MQFNLDPEQRLLSDSIERFVGNEYGFDAFARRLTEGEHFRASTWETFADNGWLAAALPEAHGGIGGSVVETAIISQQLGRGLVLEPYLGCAVLAAQTLVAAAAEFQKADWLPGLADGAKRLALAYSEPGSQGMAEPASSHAEYQGGGWRLTGRKSLVLGGEGAVAFIVSANGGGGLSLFLVAADAPGVSVRPVRLHDGRGAVELDLDQAEAQMLSIAGRGLPALRTGLAHGMIALCSELVGVMESAIEITAPYLRTRQQFGAPLSTLQVLQHRMADMAAELELARSILFGALASFESDGPHQRDEVLAGAKAFISRAALNVCGQAIQLHGGIGMTEEYSIGHYYRRATVGAMLLGGATMQEEACAASLRRRLLVKAPGQ